MRRLLRLSVAWTLALLLLVGGCGAKADVITISANTAAIVGEQALETNSQYVGLCTTNALPVQKCNAWSVWFTQFKKDYAKFHATFATAVAKADLGGTREASEAIRALATDLTLYTIYGR